MNLTCQHTSQLSHTTQRRQERERDQRMASEMNNFIKVWISILTSLSYCYAISKLVSKGIKRLVFFVPIVCLFLFVPLILSSINLIGCTAFFISWLGSSKLLLFAFGKGPLASDPSKFNLSRPIYAHLLSSH